MQNQDDKMNTSFSESGSVYQQELQPFSQLLQIRVLFADENSAYGELEYRRELTDLLGHMTGGAYNALADAVAGACARANGCMYVTQNCSMQYYVSTEEPDGVLCARAHLRHRGSRTCIVDVELTHRDGTVVSDGQFSYSKI